MKRKSTTPRNPFVAAVRFRKAGKHGKTEKALRRAARMEIQQGGFGRVARQQAFNLYQVSSNLTGPTKLHNESGSRSASVVQFPDSSAVERATVNRDVGGSIPPRGARV